MNTRAEQLAAGLKPAPGTDWCQSMINVAITSGDQVLGAIALQDHERENAYGEAEVRETFKVARVGTIAGCIVRSGNMNRKGRMRVIRDGVEIYDGGIASLRRFKDDVNEVKEGYECGIGIENFNDVKIGDVFECYRTEEVARTLDQASKS